MKIHSFGPIYNENSRILILGTMPSPASLKMDMYYSHPRNAFWHIMRDLTGDTPGTENSSKREFLLRHGIALWDTLCSCERDGALDGNIKAEQPNDVAGLIENTPLVRAVFLNGKTSLKFYKRYHAPHISLPYFYLPSTSPANARGGYAKKFESWKMIQRYIIICNV